MFAKLDDYVFGIKSGSSWSTSVGVSPYTGSFICDKDKAVELVNNATVDGSTLTINDGKGNEQIFEKLTILRATPTNNPNEHNVLVVDRRWKWPRVWVKRAYNIRRKTGRTKKLAKETLNLAEMQPDVTYQSWSLKGGKPWTAEEVLKDILKVLVGEEGEVNLTGMKDMPVVESLEIDSPGDVALGRVFSILGDMMSVYIDRQGKAKVFDVFSGKEGVLVGLAMGTSPAVTTVDLVHGYPTWMIQDRHIERPVKVRVLFTRAVEVRFDHAETDVERLLDKTGVRDRIIWNPQLENVVPVPEDVDSRSFELGDNSTIPVGSYLRVEHYLDWLYSQPPPKGLPYLSKRVLNESWMQGALDTYAGLDPSGLWGRRIGALRMHYRRTYRVQRPYSERIRKFSAQRVKLQDAETDGYLAAPAFFDYATYESWRGMGLNRAADLEDFGKIVKNRFAHRGAEKDPGPIVDSPLRRLRPAPVNIKMIDPVLGIFSIDFYHDISAQATKYIHSALTQVPTEDPKGSDIWLQDGHLSPERELSVVLTTFPAAPNDNRQLYAFDVMADTTGAIGQRSYTIQKAASGPAMEIRVMPNVAMARYQWPDNKEKGEKIKRWFTESITPSDERPNDSTEDNAIFGLPVNPEELQAVAFARAREVFAKYTDHLDGGATTDIRIDIEPVGTVKEVVHSASPDGALTSVTFPPDPPKVDLGQYMPASVRKLVNRDEE
tara:strand:+ start:5789 stop:7942 length:2154 start_codon:yes stop_codon:yes gene_type:complete